MFLSTFNQCLISVLILLFRCACDQGYTGQKCESRYYPCSPSPCQNGGKCSQLDAYSYQCTCPRGNNSINNNYNNNNNKCYKLILIERACFVTRHYESRNDLNYIQYMHKKYSNSWSLGPWPPENNSMLLL